MEQQLVRTIVVWAGLVAFMMASQPAKLPVILLILPFILLFLVVYETWGLMRALYGRYLSRTRQIKKRSQLGMMVSIGIVLLIVLQSLQQLTIRDVGTVAAILVIGYLYIVRNRHQAESR